MPAQQVRDHAAASASPKAVLLRGKAVSPQDEKLARLLDWLEVCGQRVCVGETASGSDWRTTQSAEQFCVVSSASCMVALLENAAGAGGDLPSWLTKAESVYVYGFGEDDASQGLLRFLTCEPGAKVRSMEAKQALVS